MAFYEMWEFWIAVILTSPFWFLLIVIIGGLTAELITKMWDSFCGIFKRRK